ncbi:indolepyruvate ferredoxin oxidoreductase subunit alpha [Acetohalobium arabaticum]|uniref:Indolepyruvate oxidoreductase subunit IorA n=1 Tax=Acetohalobium arabaticum (strain ATCC 49924 / DSM 5501 / Z-7288) TaxID=574087 RepID=D9QSD4_ACEAZ|nr:indolepyruvate ferredoxin oxidoreductase subunit alpha [Acetohalobium arabaticum]ADL13397.1 indolepyruvate ferredoxin oxidoreductase, alpha subunit [Acetohalobium arabaticum DSM 5501]
MEKVLLSGNEAVARGAYEAGVKVATAYPGTPSTEILENIVQYKDDIHCQWSPNEKVSMEVAIGAAFGGVRSLVAMKHVGLNVAADPFMTLSYTGIRGGLVVVSADDPSMHSSQNEQDNRHYARFAKVPMLEPADSQEAKDFVGYALDISEEFDTPVILRTTTRISHAKTVVEPGGREEYSVPEEFEKDPDKFVMVPANAYKRHPKIEERLNRVGDYAETSPLNRVEGQNQELGIITSGVTYNHAKEVFPEASFLKLGITYPLPEKKIKKFAKQVDKLYVIEELDPFLENQIKAMGIEVTGKDKLPLTYELNTKVIRESFIEEKVEDTIVEESKELPPRPPALCPGCPHRGVFYSLNKLGVTVTGDIGCYALGVVPPLSAMDTLVCMGASIGNAFGLELALGDKIKGDVVGVIGDSTYMHSGITGLIDIMYNKGASTIVILDNRITAMTGHQENPVTGKTLMGEDTVEVDLVELNKALGVENVRTVDPYDLGETKKVITEELEKDEISVVVAQRSCVLLDSVERKAPYTVDSDKCQDCGQCLDIGCPALVKEEGEAKINDYLCTGCGVCTEICVFDAIVRDGGSDE